MTACLLMASRTSDSMSFSESGRLGRPDADSRVT